MEKGDTASPTEMDPGRRPEEGLLGFYLDGANGRLIKDQVSSEEIESQVQAKLARIQRALTAREQVSIPLWGHSADASDIHRYHGITDLRSVKLFPDVVEDPLLQDEAFIKILQRLGVRESEFQNPVVPRAYETSAEAAYVKNKVVPAKDKRVYFHLVNIIEPYTARAIAFVTTNVDYHKKVPPKIGEPPKGLFRSLFRR